MGAWVVTVGAIALLTLLCDSILPDGSTKKYVKTVLGVVVSFVIVTSLMTAVAGISLQFQETKQTFQTQDNYLATVQNQRQQEVKKTIYQIAQSCDVAITDVVFDGDCCIVFAKSGEQNISFENAVRLLKYSVTVVWE